MSVRDIRILGDSSLREKAVETAFTPKVKALIDDLFDTMDAADGIGLAATQIGVSLRVFVYDVREEEAEPGALVNPRIVSATGSVKESEGCLSIPGLTEIVRRDDEVVVEGLDREGNPTRIEAAGLLSRCLQHENDHLDGVLFIDRISAIKRKMLLQKWKKMDESEKQPIRTDGQL
jgi:peptide deformylase